LKEADIVVTNPPFSLFRDYVGQLIEYDKKFVIIGNQNAITYKEIFPLLKDNKMWLGFGFKGGAAHFINKYYDHYSLRKYITSFKDMLSETIEKLTNDFSESLFENIDDDIDYSKSYNELVEKIGFEHPALKYIAINETKNLSQYTSMLMEQADSDADIIFENIKLYSKNNSECQKIIQEMIENNADKIKNKSSEINRKNGKEVAERLFNKLNESMNSSPITSALFNIVHTKRPLNNSKIEFLKTIEKYFK
jgi:hypothetical protein